jgi:hypothetical protein
MKGKLWKDIHDRTAKPGSLGKDSYDRKAMTRHLWKDSKDFGLGFGLATMIDYRDAKKKNCGIY